MMRSNQVAAIDVESGRSFL